MFYGFAFTHMKIVAFVSGKGGVGKTTLGFLLGVALQRAQRRVSFLDLDPQASLTSLLELHNVNRDEGATTEFLIVDTPPRLESKEVRESVERADVICIPMRPSPMDFGVTTNTAQLVNNAEAAREQGIHHSESAQKGDLLVKEGRNAEWIRFRAVAFKLVVLIAGMFCSRADRRLGSA